MSCGEPCDGCNNRAVHHLCVDCANEDIDKFKKERDMYRSEATRQMEYGIKQHEFAQDALRERDEARAVADQCKDIIAELREQAVELRASHDTVRETAVNFEKSWGATVTALGESRAEVAKLRTVLAKMDRIAEEMEQAATPHGYTGQMVRAYSKWATKISEALDSVRLP